ncbi:MAG: hypothetical protein ACI4BI_04345 [Anaerotardibacter sp.]
MAKKSNLLVIECFQNGKKAGFAFLKKEFIRNQSGQGTVEYAVVFAGFLCMIITLGLISDFLSGGTVVQHAIQSVSHGVTNVDAQVACDVFLY